MIPIIIVNFFVLTHQCRTLNCKIQQSFIKITQLTFTFNASGFEVLEKYNKTKNYCFDDLGVEPTGSHYAKECNVMGEILLSRYDLFCHPECSRRVLTHITTNLNAEELEKRYGSLVRSRLRAMFNLISFGSSSADKRK